ncbi:hypothetical protein JW887_04725 [Candidatus Dojkabacteria bacterium]|nr:hypothetical protein [Candidatus Dojkabacteria bacterium]
MKSTVSKGLYWTPRILSILFLVFLFLMSLDVFDAELSLWEIVRAFFIHNIPAIVLLIILVISWKYEVVGAVAFFLAGLLYIFLVFQNNFAWYKLVWAIEISGISFLIASLFLAGWIKKRKKN